VTRWKAPYAEVRATALAYVRAHDSQAGAFRVMSVARAIAPSLDIAHNEARLGTDRVAVQNLGVQVKRVLDALVKDGSLVLVRDGRASLYYTPAAAAMLTRLHDESVARVEGNRRRREDVLTRLRKVREEEPVDDDTAVMTLPLSAVEHLLTLAELAPLCPNGCGCRLGSEDAEVRDCACDGLCCYDVIEVSEVFAERDRLRKLLDATPREGDLT